MLLSFISLLRLGLLALVGNSAEEQGRSLIFFSVSLKISVAKSNREIADSPLLEQ
jgi:hypothetical protein